jgi:hypothetical protein
MMRLTGGYGHDDSALAKYTDINYLNTRMLPQEYVDLHWDDSLRDTLKPFTGPKKPFYQKARELDHFPRLSCPGKSTMLTRAAAPPTSTSSSFTRTKTTMKTKRTKWTRTASPSTAPERGLLAPPPPPPSCGK